MQYKRKFEALLKFIEKKVTGVINFQDRLCRVSVCLNGGYNAEWPHRGWKGNEAL